MIMDSDDDFGCLGIPTPEEMWKQQTVLLATEIEEYQQDLRQAKANIRKLVLMVDTLTAERDTLQSDLRKATTSLSAVYLKESQAATKQMGYVYGDHTQ
jgi:uncharacterized coiled-coil DUF342 family protein